MQLIAKKILIVNVYFPEMRESIKRVNEVPNALAPVLLAGYFSQDHCEVKLYNEVNSGFIEVFDPDLLAWPDMVVLTGLTAAFDRLLHVTAYVRSANPQVIVAAGGHGVRALPRYSEQFFDYTCTGDVDEIQTVITTALGPEYVSKEFLPRYDLAYWMKTFGYAESSRNCNFKCSFCSLTGVGLKYDVQSTEYLEAQLEQMGKRTIMFFLDNQVMGSGHDSLKERVMQMQKRREQGQFKTWGGFVTNTFFWEDRNIELARDTGCMSVFVGVESFDDNVWLKSVNKKQNSRNSQVEMIRRCMDGGVLFQYGLVFDPTEQTVAQMHRELEIICADPVIPPPNFIFMSIPFPGTPFFHDRLAKNQILPGTRMRDLEASTLTLKSIDPIEDVVHFIKNARNFRGYRWRFMKHHVRHLWRYKGSLNGTQIILSVLTAFAILAPGKFSSPGSIFVRKRKRTNVGGTDHLDRVYTPRLPVAEAYRHYFEPTVILDDTGEVNPLLRDDVLDTRFKRAAKPAKPAAKMAVIT